MRKLCKALAESVMLGAIVAGALTSSAAVAYAAPPVPNWDEVAQCESGGNWHANTGNGKYGGLQFKPATWARYGGVGNPAAASREEQIAVANRVLDGQGIEAWPKCGTASGLPIGLYSHPAQGIKQIINGIIRASLPHF